MLEAEVGVRYGRNIALCVSLRHDDEARCVVRQLLPLSRGTTSVSYTGLGKCITPKEALFRFKADQGVSHGMQRPGAKASGGQESVRVAVSVGTQGRATATAGVEAEQRPLASGVSTQQMPSIVPSGLTFSPSFQPISFAPSYSSCEAGTAGCQTSC